MTYPPPLPARPGDRCTSTANGLRCQLMPHDDDRHYAMVASVGGESMYETWGEDATLSGEPIGKPARFDWAPGFPQVEGPAL